MTRRRKLNDRQVAALKPRTDRYAMPDPELVGHYVMLQPSGVKTFKAVARDPFGKQVWVTLGRADHVGIEQSRHKARAAIARIRIGKSAFKPPPPAPDSFAMVAAGWLQRHVAKKALRSERQIRQSIERLVMPVWGDRPFVEIRRTDVARLLDHIEDKHGSRMADLILAYVSGIANWYAQRNDEYVSPISRGMRRISTKESARSRVLDDDEIRAVWALAEKSGTYGAVIQLLLLCAQRLSKVITMRWDDVSVDGVWTIATAPREKTNAGTLALPEAAIAVIRRQPRIEGNPFVFAGRGRAHIGGLTKLKARFDAGLPPMPRWTPHDCRRTARSLMSRAGVPSEHAERALGHAIKSSIEATYNRYDYGPEKKIALEKLAALISEIVNGTPSGKIVPLRREA